MTITEPPEDIVVERDVAVPMRDGVSLRANVFRPAAAGRYPVLLCAHPYSKTICLDGAAGGGAIGGRSSTT